MDNTGIHVNRCNETAGLEVFIFKYNTFSKLRHICLFYCEFTFVGDNLIFYAKFKYFLKIRIALFIKST